MRLPKFNPKLSPRVQKLLKVLGYGCFYWFLLILFSYLTFPYQRLRDRIVSEFNARQTGPDPLRLEIDGMSAYWLSGIEADGIRLISEAKPATPGSDAPAPKPSVLAIDSAHARVSLLPLLIGNFKLSFGASAFGGSVSGQSWETDGTRKIEVEIEDFSLDKITLLADAVGLPLAGTLSGNLDFSLPEGKLSKSDGTVSLKIKGLSAGDGKAKIRDTIALPKVEAGDLGLDGEATTGLLKVTNFAASGPDLELTADGSVRLRDPFQSSMVSLGARFRFSERYMGKNDMTKALFGNPGSAAPALFDLDPKNRRAKGPDGFYGWRVAGTINQPQFTPHPSAGPTSPAAKK